MYKVGDKLVCYNAVSYRHITLNKTYTIIKVLSAGGVTIINDGGYEDFYAYVNWIKYFRSLRNERKLKLERLKNA